MGFRAHIHTKHVIEYSDSSYFNWNKSRIYDWLVDNGVDIWPGPDADYNSWVIYKPTLDNIPEEAYKDIDEDILAEDLRRFVEELKQTKTGYDAYVDWFQLEQLKLVEQGLRNAQVVGSNPISSTFVRWLVCFFHSP